MSDIKPSDLIALFNKALIEKWGYIGGKAGVKWTEAAQSAAEQAYRNGDSDWEMAARYGRKWIGKRVADCSGMFAWAFKELGGYMYHGSNTMWSKYTEAKGRLINGARDDGEPLKPGTAVFKVRNETDYYHVGLFIGAGVVIEARGTQSGVVTSNVSTWHTWGELKGVDYTNTEPSDIITSAPNQTTTTTTSNPLLAIQHYDQATTTTTTTTGGGAAMSTTNAVATNAVVSATGGVNMRTEMSTKASRVLTIPNGAALVAEKIDDTWASATYNGKTGYVMARYITFTENNSQNDIAAIIRNIEQELSRLKTLIQRR